MALNAGLDVELPGDDCAPHLREALERGLITIETVEAAVRRVLREKFRTADAVAKPAVGDTTAFMTAVEEALICKRRGKHFVQRLGHLHD